MEGNKRKPQSSLPCDIIFSILLKLSVESLLRCRYVCKSWLAIISGSQFVKSHLNESIKLDRQRIVRWDELSNYFFSTDFDDDSEEKLYLPFGQYRKAIDGARVVCSCNGLVLLGLDHEKCVLWNPSTRAYKKWTCPYPIYKPYGLCYDSSLDDYKVILISGTTNSFVVFSFKFQRWTEVKWFPYSGFVGDMVTVNGVLHGAALNCSWSRSSSDSDSDGDVIVYYDMVDEKFKEMPPPNCLTRGDKFRLAVMSGRLSLYCNTIDENYAEVWTMKQYGEQNSWTKLFVVPRLVRLPPRHLEVHLRPLCATKKGDEVVMIDDDYGRIRIYNPEKKKFRSLRHTRIKRLSVVLVVDSLVLPTGMPRGRGKKKKEL